MPFPVLIRADASSRIGTGHVFRCMAIAEELVRRGHKVHVVSRDTPGAIPHIVAARGFPVTMIADDPASDLNATLAVAAAFAGGAPFWAIVDHYRLAAEFHAGLKAAGAKVLVIDDMADRPLDPDILMDSGKFPGADAVYDAVVARPVPRLIGPDYVLLRADVRAVEARVRDFARVERLLFTFGGNDPPGITLRYARLLADPRLSGFAADVTVGSSNPRRAEVEAAVAALAGRAQPVRLHVDTPALPDLMNAADLGIGAGGTTAWERCYLGLPALVFVLDDNQIAFAATLASTGAVRLAGDPRQLEDAALVSLVAAAAADRAWQQGASEAGRRLVDGKGVARVVDAMEALDAGHPAAG